MIQKNYEIETDFNIMKFASPEDMEVRETEEGIGLALKFADETGESETTEEQRLPRTFPKDCLKHGNYDDLHIEKVQNLNRRILD
ncbi:MAG: hypothetical protein FWF42_02055 [Streptococcaceae bacterium]|nr:hypothetical protein [Streptococcaceae bacterium]